MIYLDNTQDLQEVWVPRNDGIRATRDDCFSTGYDSGYTDGFNDGRMSGASLQEKEVYLDTEVTEITPDEGYDGMSKVTANASGYGNTRYEDGRNEVLMFITPAMVTMDSDYAHYTAEPPYYGYSEITIDSRDYSRKRYNEGRNEVLSHIVPTAVTMGSESISFEAEDPNYGFSEVSVDATEYGNMRYEEGHTIGYDEGRNEVLSHIVSTAVTMDSENLHIEAQNPNYGFSRVSVDASEYGDNRYNEGKEEILSGIGATAITENGNYVIVPDETIKYGWSSVTVNVPTGTAINNQSKSVSITANGVTNITHDSEYTGLENVEVTVNVPQTGGTGKLRVADYPGLKVGSSTWTEVPDYLDFEGVTDMSFMFAGTNLSGSQTFDLSGVTTVADMYNRATSITALTLTGADDVEAMNGVAYECTALESFEMYGACRPTRMDSAFYNNDRLKGVILPDTSKVTKMENIFYFCGQLTGVTLNTDSVTGINGAFAWCTSITEIHLTSLANIPTNHYMGNTFSNCGSLEVLTLTAWPDKNLDNIGLNDSSLLTHESIIGLLNALPQSTGGYSFQIGQTNIDKLTEEEIAIATDKGWTLI